MKNSIFLIIFLLIVTILKGQNQFWDEYFLLPSTLEFTSIQQKEPSSIRRSEDGYNFPTTGNYRLLTIFVNIIYDSIYYSYDPNISNIYWPINNIEGINQLDLHSYFNDILDSSTNQPRSGYFTRFMSACSFDSLILISDFTSVEIKASRINQIANAAGYQKIADGVIKYINDKGGLNAVFGHNNIKDYDKLSGITKTTNNKIDYIVFAIRNPSSSLYGFSYGSGYGGVIPDVPLLLSDSQKYYIENSMMIGVGHYNLKYEPYIMVHEFAHALLGPNSFHSSGGNHFGSSYINTFIGFQHGYGLFGGGLRSCNGYERWRLNWKHSTNSIYKISASGINGEINEKFSGTKAYYLRDFFTYGDAIRIKLPYKDSELSSNQYIWFENHQIGKNQLIDIDVFQYSTFPGLTCVPKGKPGIYSYVQVGKDILESTNYTLIYPGNETDNLRMINAEGNYNMTYNGVYNDCAGWGERVEFLYNDENAISGNNDQTEVFNYNINNSTLQKFSDFSYMGSKFKDGSHYNRFPSIGDELDCFNDSSTMNISSNPTPINMVTYYSKYYKPTSTSVYYEKLDDNRDTRKKYLTGLNITMTKSGSNQFGDIFKLDVRWDDYDIKRDINWTGDIVLKEHLNLLSDKQIILEQNLTPNQIYKDSVSNFFAKTTFFTCESNSAFNMKPNSKLILKDKSSLIINSNADFTMENGSLLNVESGSTLQIKTGANFKLIGSAKIVIKSGGYICIESGANINLQDYTSLIVLEEGANYGANPALFPSPSCSSSITKTGNGTIVDYSQDVYIQNETLSVNRYIGGKNIFVGNHVTTSKTFGDVLINNGANIIFDCKEILFDAGFECANGSSYEVKNH